MPRATNRERSGRELDVSQIGTFEQAAPQNNRRRPFEIVTSALPLLAVGGGVLFALIRLLLASFYSRLGVTPEEVGWGVDSVLSQSAPAWVILSSIGLSAIWIARKETGHLRQVIDWIAEFSVPLGIVMVPALLIALVASPVVLGLADVWSAGLRGSPCSRPVTWGFVGRLARGQGGVVALGG